MSLVYLNGEFKPLESATLNVLDRGFTFGDGVYEVIPVFNRKVFRFEQHMQRLTNSLESIYMSLDITNQQWQEIFTRLIDDSPDPHQSIYLQVTRGVSPRDHDIDLADEPTVFAMSRPIQKKDLSAGIKAISHEDIRWSHCDIKAITLLPSVMLRHRAKLKGAKEAILFRDNMLTEGAASNVFIVKSNIVYTTPKNHHVLPGITRDLLLEILERAGVEYQEQSVSLEFVKNADEVWVSSSTWEIVPVTQLDEDTIGDGKPGALYEKINRLYLDYRDNGVS